MSLAAVLLLAFAVPPVLAGVSIPCTRDNTLFFDPAGQVSDGSGPVFFVGNNSQGNTRRGVVRFEVAAALPPGSVVVYAQLRLTVSNAANDTAHAIALHRVLSDWGEGASYAASGTGDAAQSGDATWLHTFYPGLYWSVPGGDFQAAVSASVPVGGVGTYIWSGPGLVADVQRWLDDPGHNFGWLLQGDEAHLSTARRFESRESAVPANRPTLAVEVQSSVDVPPHGPGPTFALGPAMPNPTRDAARLEFRIPHAGRVRLTLDDASGRRVANLLDRFLPEGRHAATWDGRDAAGATVRPGMYFCTLILDEHRRSSQRLVVTR